MAWLVYRSIDEEGNCYEPRTEQFTTVEDARAAQRILQYAGENNADLLQSEVVDSEVPDIQRVIDNWYAEDKEELERDKKDRRERNLLIALNVDRWKEKQGNSRMFQDIVCSRLMDVYNEATTLQKKEGLPGFTVSLRAGYREQDRNGATFTWDTTDWADDKDEG